MRPPVLAPTTVPGSHHSRAERALSLPQLIPPDSHPPLHSSDSHPPLHRLGKPDIKMGVGGVLGRGGAPPGPPKPPRALDRDTGGTHSLDRNLDGRAHQDHRATHSLDRDRSREHCPLRDRSVKNPSHNYPKFPSLLLFIVCYQVGIL